MQLVETIKCCLMNPKLCFKKERVVRKENSKVSWWGCISLDTAGGDEASTRYSEFGQLKGRKEPLILTFLFK